MPRPTRRPALLGTPRQATHLLDLLLTRINTFVEYTHPHLHRQTSLQLSSPLPALPPNGCVALGLSFRPLSSCPFPLLFFSRPVPGSPSFPTQGIPSSACNCFRGGHPLSSSKTRAMCQQYQVAGAVLERGLEHVTGRLWLRELSGGDLWGWRPG